MEWPAYSIAKANEDFNNITIDSLSNVIVPSSYKELRNDLINIRDLIYERNNFDSDKFKEAIFDLEFGLELYVLLNNKYDFTNREASNNDIWRFINIRVIPDVVNARWGLNENYFYKEPRRIWTKRIYWYINLGWQGNKQETYDILKNNETDDIANIVERPGQGYNIELYREILRQYAFRKQNDKRLLRKIMVLNTARQSIIYPELTSSGIEGYVNELFESVMSNG